MFHDEAIVVASGDGGHVLLHRLAVVPTELAAQRNLALRAGEARAHHVGATRHLAAVGGHMHAVAIVVVDGDRVVDVARRTPPAPAHAKRAHRTTPDEPVGKIDLVDGLLRDLVATHLPEVVPVVAEIGGVRVFRTARTVPDGPVAAIDATGHDLSDRSVAHGANLLEEAVRVAMERAGKDGQVLRLRVRHHLQEITKPARIGRNGLFGEDVLAGGDAGRGVERTKDRRRAQQHDFAVRGDHLQVAVGAPEGHLFIDAILAAYVQRLVTEEVRRRHKLHVMPKALGSRRDVADGTARTFAAEPVAAASATTDETHLEHALRATCLRN